MLNSASPRWADQLLRIGEPQHGLKGQNISYPTPGLAVPGDHTALLTHETNTCKLFKNISIKLPGWLRAAPIRSARAPSSPQPPIPPWEVLRGGQNLFCTLFPGIVQFLGQDFRQAAGCPDVLGVDQPLAGHYPGRLRKCWRERIIGPVAAG